MKLDIKVFFIFLTIISTTYSRDNVSLFLNISNENQDKFKSLVIGVSDTATDSYDFGLEKEMPPFPPPSGNIPYLKMFDSAQTENIYTTSDFKGTYGKTSFEKIYHFVMLGQAIMDYTLSWGTLPPQISAAIIYDEATGTIVNADMKVKSSVLVNKFLQDVFIKISFDLTKTEVEEENNLFSLSPNPTTDIIYLKGLENQTIELFNSIGENIDKISNSSQLSLQNYPQGVYFLKFKTNNRYFIKKIVKI
jgi:hypothetical protein